MRVLQLGKYYHPYKGGIENHLYVLCNEIKKHVALEVVVSNTKPRSERSVVEGVPVLRCAEVANVSSTSICPTMPLALGRTSYDILHVHFPHPMGVLSYLSSRKPAFHSLVVSYHSDIVRQKRLLTLYAPLMNAVLRRADAIVCASPAYRDSSPPLQPYRGKCEVLPYGIDLGHFRRTPAHERAAAEIRQRFGHPLILSVGRHVYYKGFEYLIRAMRSVSGHALLIGDGPLRPSLQRLAHEAGVADRVHFLGEVHDENLISYYLAADIFVLPSIARSEAFGIVQLEAMAGGLPVVNTALDSGVPFVSRHGESGLTVPPKDPDALAKALQELIAQPERRAKLGEAGRRRVTAEFSKELMAEGMMTLYRQVRSNSIQRRVA